MKKMHLDIINFLFDKNRELINHKETILNLLLENYGSLIDSLKEYKSSKPPRINIFKLIDEEYLSSSSEEDTFMQDKLKELLQNNDAYNNISTPEEAQEYIDLIESTITVLNNKIKIYINYVKDVLNILNSEYGIKDFELHEILNKKIDRIRYNRDEEYHSIWYYSKNIPDLCCILVLKYENIYCGFYTGDIDSENTKKVIIYIKNNIKWLKNFKNRDNGLWYDIDINNESAEDTASKMKELYEALKNIK
ncbi:hypothetical protein [uncultured Brachyspira sp.]|uniref:hypothetical protein n=1 Tax=uncultured Brachyspira sp. TaxID=221953 RepID=UPI0025E3F815|nr:hypothetical protein [uncultured Brachyspira sp.]